MLPRLCLSRATQEAPGNGLLQLEPPLDSPGKKFSCKDKIMGQCDKVVLSLTAIPSAQRDSGAQTHQPAMPTAARTIWEGTRTRQSLASHQWLQEKKKKKKNLKRERFPLLCMHTMSAAPACAHPTTLHQGADCFGGAPRPG